MRLKISLWEDFGVSYVYHFVLSDSSDNVCIEDCSIAMGHDAIALKSGWDEYGITYGRQTTDVHHHQALPLHLVVKCLVAFRMFKWTRSTYTTH